MNFFNKMSMKVKAIAASILGILSFVLYFFIRSKISAKDKMDYELSRVSSEIEIANLSEDSEEKLLMVSNLKEEESLIREKIKFLEDKKREERIDLSVKDLENFFKERDL